MNDPMELTNNLSAISKSLHLFDRVEASNNVLTLQTTETNKKSSPIAFLRLLRNLRFSRECVISHPISLAEL